MSSNARTEVPEISRVSENAFTTEASASRTRMKKGNSKGLAEKSEDQKKRREEIKFPIENTPFVFVTLTKVLPLS